MSIFSEKRMAENIATAMQERNPIRRRRDAIASVVNLAVGIGVNFLSSRAEIAAVFWFLTLCFAADFLCSLGRLSWLYGIRRWSIDALVVMIGCAASTPFLLGQYRSQHAALTSGVLHPIGDGKDHSHEPPVLQVGGARFAWAGPEGQPMLKVWRNKLTIRRVGNELKLSITVRDSQENLIAEIVDNRWTVNPSKSACWDKNYDDDSLEVKDGRGRVVLQVRVLPESIQLQVEFPDHNDRLIEDGQYSDEDGIRPRFRYPSSEHWGELDAGSVYPRSSLTLPAQSTPFGALR